jgi:hypothetical protein
MFCANARVVHRSIVDQPRPITSADAPPPPPQLRLLTAKENTHRQLNSSSPHPLLPPHFLDFDPPAFPPPPLCLQPPAAAGCILRLPEV